MKLTICFDCALGIATPFCNLAKTPTWHGLTVITTSRTGFPQRDLGHLLFDWREKRPEERKAAVAAMRVARQEKFHDRSARRRWHQYGPAGRCNQAPSHVESTGVTFQPTGTKEPRCKNISHAVCHNQGQKATDRNASRGIQQGKIMDEWPDQSAISNLVVYRPSREEHYAANTRVRWSLKSVLEEIDYWPTNSKKQSWHDNNPSAFKDDKNNLGAVMDHLKRVHTHKQKLKIISGLSVHQRCTYISILYANCLTHVRQKARNY